VLTVARAQLFVMGIALPVPAGKVRQIGIWANAFWKREILAAQGVRMGYILAVGALNATILWVLASAGHLVLRELVVVKILIVILAYFATGSLGAKTG